MKPTREAAAATLRSFVEAEEKNGLYWRHAFTSGYTTRMNLVRNTTMVTRPEEEEILTRLEKDLAQYHGKQVGREELKKRLVDAIHRVKEKPPEERVATSLECAGNLLKQPGQRERWMVWMEVGGVDPEEFEKTKEIEFGGIRFRQYEEDVRREIVEACQAGKENRKTEEMEIIVEQTMKVKGGKFGRPRQIATMEPLAFTAEEAIEEAHAWFKEVQLVLALLSRTWDAPQSWLYHEEDRNNETCRGVVAASQKGAVRIPGQTRHNMENVRLHRMMKEKPDADHPHRGTLVQELSETVSRRIKGSRRKRYALEERVMEGLQSLGQAVIEHDGPKTVLYCMTGLEHIACNDDQKHGRREKTLWWWGKQADAGQSRRLRRLMKKLYILRDGITHKGTAEVNEETREAAKQLAIASGLKTLEWWIERKRTGTAAHAARMKAHIVQLASAKAGKQRADVARKTRSALEKLRRAAWEENVVDENVDTKLRTLEHRLDEAETDTNDDKKTGEEWAEELTRRVEEIKAATRRV